MIIYNIWQLLVTLVLARKDSAVKSFFLLPFVL